MWQSTKRVFSQFCNPGIAILLLSILGGAPAMAEGQATDDSATRRVDVVIALDVSGSMSGLIESAKQRLWDIVNELDRAQPQPDLRMAILTYGKPAYGEANGYVRLDLPFTRDLDAVNQTLFSFGTDGGDEYVARVVSTAIDDLDWSEDPDALKIIFVAGNEGANQDPQITTAQISAIAANKGIVVNTIYCGSENDSDANGWRQVASLAGGMFASIDQNAAAVANIATPMDQEIATLNESLNETYLSYGADGDNYRDNQVAQDKNSLMMGSSAAASRAVTKSGKMYDASKWDLVDAVQSGAKVEEIEVADLPEVMQHMEAEERKEYVAEQAGRREALKAQILELDKERQAYIVEEKRKISDEGGKGLDDAIQEGLRTIAREKGFTFEDES